MKVRLRAAGVEPDGAAGGRFRSAATRLQQASPSSDEARQAQLDGALALLALAAGGHDAELATYLAPDPAEDTTTWTVVCYQLGDLSPSAIRDFADASDALATLLRCDDDSHRAAELISSTATGLHWTALVRTGEQVAFQLPHEDTLRSGQPDHVRDALARWTTQLGRWADGAGPSLPAAPALPAADRPPTATTTDLPPGTDDRLDAVARTLALLAGRITTLVDRPDAASAVDERLSAVAHHLKGLSDGLLAEALRHNLTVEAQVERIASRVETQGDRLHLQIAALDAKLPSAIEPRLDFLADRLDEVLDRLARLEAERAEQRHEWRP